MTTRYNHHNRAGQLVFIFASIFLAHQAVAQQLPLFTQYREHVGVLNPAAVAGSYFLYDQTGSVGISARKQWVGREGAPQTQVVQGYFLKERDNAHPIMGGHLINDEAGQVATTGLYGRVGCVLSHDPDESGMAFGMAMGLVQYRVSLQGAVVRDPGDPLVLNPDLHKRIFPDASVGVYTWKKVSDYNYVVGGVSIPQVMGLDLKFKNDSTGKFNLHRVRHFYGMFGWVRDLTNNGNKIEVNGWIKHVPNAPTHFDINTRYEIGQDAWDWWVGLGYGTSRAMHIETGFVLGEERPIRIGYACDFNTSNKTLAFGNSHEINLSYGFGGKRRLGRY
jgi:type IX secretion system PorP/SprF family membrane protein